jgi:hypothetical protein
MASPYEGISISSGEVRHVIWGFDKISSEFEEAVILYRACVGALEDLRQRAPLPGTKYRPTDIDRMRYSAFTIMNAVAPSQADLNSAIEGHCFK